MDASQVNSLIEAGRLQSFDVKVHERNGRLIVNDKVALPVRCDVSMPRLGDVEIISQDGDSIGVLCFTSIGGAPALDKSDYELAAYLVEQDYSDFSLSRSLSMDYVVIDEYSVDEYLEDYAESSAIWGGYAHVLDSSGVEERPYSSFITARRGLKLMLPAAESLCHRAVAAAHPFERYLKHYHQLELLVDWYVARRISRLPPTLVGFDKLMSNYSSSDINKVKGLLKDFCSDLESIKALLDGVAGHWDVAEKIFQEFGKGENPLSENAWPRVKTHGVPLDDSVKVAAYWLFRVRCSIAHHRIGEYLLREDDQKFVVEFAEPLLIEVIKQVLGNERLHALA